MNIYKWMQSIITGNRIPIRKEDQRSLGSYVAFRQGENVMAEYVISYLSDTNKPIKDLIVFLECKIS